MRKLLFSLSMLISLAGAFSGCRKQSRIPEPAGESVPLILPEINPARSVSIYTPARASEASNPVRPVFEFIVNPSQVADVQLETV